MNECLKIRDGRENYNQLFSNLRKSVDAPLELSSPLYQENILSSTPIPNTHYRKPPIKATPDQPPPQTHVWIKTAPHMEHHSLHPNHDDAEKDISLTQSTKTRVHDLTSSEPLPRDNSNDDEEEDDDSEGENPLYHS
ncbi:hypothetical protein BN59_02141 [Legionella massiliensis]|uniref:Uncharacterized protein n=1 Tax=Legionella massiliensis TaxID=1034943 RepID=A0A078L1A5_9GAMM|nr:hypothetical protein [Legionella massiliensis]CDZ77848.1 hypothetical protein BN59_02141 [Legionella massiliensis]CEE13586.1 hypothetical protein BN1094_02141 [Legionella massiliensis]